MLHGKLEAMKYVGIVGIVLAPIGFFGAWRSHRLIHLAVCKASHCAKGEPLTSVLLVHGRICSGDCSVSHLGLLFFYSQRSRHTVDFSNDTIIDWSSKSTHLKGLDGLTKSTYPPQLLPLFYLYQLWKVLPTNGMQAFAKFQTSQDVLDLV